MALPWININAQYANGNTPLILAIQGELFDFIYNDKCKMYFLLLQEIMITW
jgi:hypothetical protein